MFSPVSSVLSCNVILGLYEDFNDSSFYINVIISHTQYLAGVGVQAGTAQVNE